MCRRGFPEGSGPLEEHHIFYGSHCERAASEHYGLKVLLCVGHHRTGRKAVHKNPESREYLCRIAQKEFERLYGHESYMGTFSRNYLEEKEWNMNKAFLMGRLTRDPEIRYTQGNEPMCIAKYTLAVDRRRKGEGGPTADFIACTSFGKAGEFIEKYCRKGTKLTISGRIQTGSYEKDGVKHYTTEVVTEEIEFSESKRTDATSQQDQSSQAAGDEGFMRVSDELDEDLPFN